MKRSRIKVIDNLEGCCVAARIFKACFYFSGNDLAKKERWIMQGEGDKGTNGGVGHGQK